MPRSKELPSDQTRTLLGQRWHRPARPVRCPAPGQTRCRPRVTRRAPPLPSHRHNAPRAALLPRAPALPGPTAAPGAAGTDPQPELPRRPPLPPVLPLPPPGPGRCQRRSSRAPAAPEVRSILTEPHRMAVIPRCPDARRRRGPPAGREARPARRGLASAEGREGPGPSRGSLP